MANLNAPDFSTWKPESLIDFAGQAYIELRQQKELIAQLRHALDQAHKETREALDVSRYWITENEQLKESK